MVRCVSRPWGEKRPERVCVQKCGRGGGYTSPQKQLGAVCGEDFRFHHHPKKKREEHNADADL
jgi:hypothetical protein